MNQEEGLTICSVYHSAESKRLLELNYDLVTTLNPGMTIRWVVADNTPEGFSEKIDPQKFIVVPGAGEVTGFLPWMWGSYRHARALKNILPYITTRFALILDGDFYILVSSWIKTIPQYMQQHGLAFFGVPWHPSYQRKWRYFPCPHTLFIDLAIIPREQLDFEPVFGDMLHPRLSERIKERVLKLFFPSGLRKRLDIGVYSDTGYPIYKRFFGKTKYECPQPVFHASVRGLDRIFPDRLSFVPKRKNYFTAKGFCEYGLPDCAGEGWEEFMWQKKPYGFHIRGSHKLKNDLDRHIAYIRDILRKCISA